MALSLTQTYFLSKLLKPGMRVASMGYPDIIAPMDLLQQMYGARVNLVEYREDSGDICRRHGLEDRKIPDAHSFFKLMECELDVYDIVQERGCEILCDLNETWAYSNVNSPTFDIVLDVGTVEHCFNIGQAMMNMAALVKVGGHILHENPFNCGNHGFYNLNPTWYVDFYEANGFEIVKCLLVSRDGRGVAVDHTKRFRFFEEEVNSFALAKRLEAKEFVFPVQSKYKNVIPAAGDESGARKVVNG